MSTERRARARDGLCIIGVIGRPGAGKSTVARALAAEGAQVIEADTLGHEVTDHDPEVRAALAAEYGADVYHADGTLDRGRVAARVFADPEARARLDRLVHPRLTRRVRERLAQLVARGFSGVVVLDAALLLDWGMERACDAVIAVVAPEERLLERLAKARGWSAEHAGLRLAAQRSEPELRAAADVTLMNDDTELALARAARQAVANLRKERC